MKSKFIVISVVVALLLLTRCETPAGNREDKDGYSIVVIDSCEYIEVSYAIGTQGGYYSLTHKGNCKYCKSRNK